MAEVKAYSNRALCPSLNLFPPNSNLAAYHSALAYFNSIPWCAALVNDGRTISFLPQCRNPENSEWDQFLGATLASDRSLKHMLCLVKPDNDDPSHLTDPSRPIRRVQTLYALSDGLCGGKKILHGGMTMTMADEASSAPIEINCALGKDEEACRQNMSVTAGLEIRFVRPIPTTSVVVATAEIEGTEKRKTRVRCVIADEHGASLAETASTWVALRTNL